MDKDFIKVSKGSHENDYAIEIYFSKINSTIKIDLKESDFLNFLLESAKLYNGYTKSTKLNFSESHIDDLIAKKQIEELRNISQEFRMLESRPEVEVVIFIADNDVPLQNAEMITNSCGDFMEAMGFELETEDEPIYGSFFKKLKYFFSSTIGEEDLVKIYEKGRKALELKYVELPTAEQTEKLSNAAEKMVNSLNCVEEGVIRCGALIVLKKTIKGKPVLIIQQLSTEMILILDKHPKLLFNVNTVYELLTGDVQNDVDDSNTQQIRIA